ncbi:uncharacterized protein LOC124941148 isoform X2 [Impatiens glandulifera]|uniref:uncharacterized protein LOC124941148 isoform X2 n=1 Tax=Impatiens glandulifera TaxID=253017 RepID=UPI001FB16DC8|nr:uncharacterized protein LOC124941148 isoform X2 [Impatiens glandulifera]
MPMDYDDNDFEDQNHHLTGEGSSKFSPVSKPYALPKFDFSESLHSQLRFDSLVEDEVFLRIPSQEDNHWIEDFSPGGGAIEFGSSAAESCSIVRHTNVWSEATSSESVEMLLKSVGQEEIVTVETIIEESEACNAFDNLTEQMDCYLSQVGDEEDNANTRTALPSDNVFGNLSGMSDTDGISQVQETEISLLENSGCLDQNAVNERHGTVVAEDNVAGETKCDTANITELSAKGLLHDETGKHPSDDMEIDDVLVNSKISSQKAVSSDEEKALLSDAVVNHQESYLPKGECYPSSDIGDEVTQCLPSDKEDDKDDTIREGAVGKEKCASDNIPHPPSEGDSGEVCITNFAGEEPTCIQLDGNHELQKTPDSGVNACSKDSDQSCYKRIEETESAGTETPHKENTDNHLTAFSSDDQETHNYADVSNSIAGTCIASEMESTKYFLNYPAEEKHILQGKDEQLDSKASLLLSVESSTSPRNLTELLGEKQVHGSGERVINVCGIHEEYLNAKDSVSPTQAENLQIAKGSNAFGEEDDTSPVESSIAPRNITELLGEKQVHGSGERVTNVGGIHEECLNAKDSVSPDTQAENLQIAKGGNASGEEKDDTSPVESSIAPTNLTELLGEKQVHGSGEGVINVCGIHEEGLNAKDSVSLCKQAENLQIAKGSNSSGVEEDDTSPNEKKITRSPGESTNVEADHIGSYGGEDRAVSAPDGKTLESESNIASGVEHVTSEEQASLLHAVPLNIDAAEETGAEALQESNGSPCTSPVEVGSIYHVLELDKTQSYGSSGELKQETVVQHLAIEKTYNSAVDIKHQNADDIVDQSLPVTDTSNTANVNKQLIDAKTGSQISSDKLEVCLPCDPEVKEGSVTEVPVSPGNNQVASAVCAGGDSSGKHDSGMLTVINNPDLSQTDRSEKGEVQESNDNISLLPDAVLVASTFQKQSDNGASKVDPNIMGLTSPSECSLKEISNKKTLPSSVKKRASKKSMGAAASPSTPVNQMVSKLASDVSSGTSMGHDVETLCGPKDTTERKTRRGSTKARGQDGARKGSVENETPSAKQSERGSKSLTAQLSISGGSPLVHFDRMKSYVQVEHGGASCLTPVSTSKLPDLNTAAPPSSSFQQPFTVGQQVQLRAQIFVYGSLIQGVVPDEAYMVSAFASDDGGRLIWEPLWRASLERLQGKKIQIIKSETPVQSHSGARPLEQQMKQSIPQVTVLPSPVGRTGCKDTLSVGNSSIPLSSPLWNVSTPFESLHSSGIPRSPFPDYHQTTTPLHPYQSPSSRSFGPSTSWLSQRLFTAPLATQPSSSTLDANARLSGRPMTEPVKLTPVKESSIPVTSGMKMGSSSISPSISVPELKKDIASSTQSSGEVKSKKRKKAPISEDVAQTFLPAQTNTGAVSTSLVISTPNFVSRGIADNTAAPLLPAPITDPKSGWKRPHQTISMSEDSSAKVEDCRQNAENAAALAATAVNESVSAWNQLAKQKSSNIISEAEAKLVSAVVAINAAASVARAAAAAAQVASNAALQAKLMADEALSSIETRDSGQVSAAFLSDAVNNLGELDAAAILNRGTDGSSSSLSIIVAAKEAARRRIEAASSASRHAENLDVILKAAELAADAVSQAGKIIMMGDPLPLNQLLEAGPSGYWRIPQQPHEQVSLVSDIYREPSRAVTPKVFPSTSGAHLVDGQIANEKQSYHALTHTSEEIHLESMENQVVTVDGNSALNISVKKEGTAKPHRDSYSTKVTLPESGIRSMLASCTTKDRIGRIEEGYLVEVCKESVNGKIAWFLATVVTLKDAKALVHHIELKSDEDSGPLKEWIALSSEGCMAPKIRIPHPITVPPHEGDKKRCRDAMVNYVFSNGDRVDVWVHNCWQEGIVMEKNQKEGTFTISFPAEEKTVVVRETYIRPTFVWRDNKWSSTMGNNELSQGDTPQAKRPRIGNAVTITIEDDKRSEPVDIVEEPQFLPLLSSEQVFNVGKNVEDNNKVNKLRTARTGLQKEGSKVIFGVPKPGKKRKFMDVSKHYVGQKDPMIVKESSSNDSTKNPKRYMSSLSSQTIGGTRPWNSNIKVDEKEKKGAAESSKVKASKSGKPPSIPSRTLQAKKKDNKVLTTTAEEDNTNTGSDSNGSEGVHNNRSSVRSENKRKAAPLGGKRIGGRVEVNESDEEYGKSNPEAAEPRRSNRRIQPTSRLLEGLQSSYVVSKFPSVSHDKSHRSHLRGGGSTSKGNGHG